MTMKVVYGLVFCIVGLQIAAGQVFKFGSCPKPSSVASINPTEHFGKWYEYAAYEGIFEGGKCTVWNFGSANQPNDADGFTNFEVTRSSINKEESKTEFTALLLAKQHGVTGNFDVKFEKLITGIGSAVVLEVNPNFAILFGCKENSFGSHFEALWVFTKTPNPSQSDVDKMKQVITSQNLPFDKLDFEVQSGCKY